MRLYEAGRAAKNFGEMLEDARNASVAIYRHGRPCAVVIDHRLFNAYRTAYEAAREDRYLSLIDTALEQMAEGKLRRGDRTMAQARRLANDATE